MHLLGMSSRVLARWSCMWGGRTSRGTRVVIALMAAVLFPRRPSRAGPCFATGPTAVLHRGAPPRLAWVPAARASLGSGCELFSTAVLPPSSPPARLRHGAPRILRRSEDGQADLRRQEGSGKEEGFFQRIGNGVKSLFGMTRRKEGSALAEADSGRPGLLGGLVGGLLIPLFQHFGGMLKEAQGDVTSVINLAQAAIARSGRLGSEVKCGTVMSQAYSSMSMNGEQLAQVQVTFQVQGSKGAGMASCGASIASDGSIDIHNLSLNGSPIDVPVGGQGGAEVIDV